MYCDALGMGRFNSYLLFSQEQDARRVVQVSSSLQYLLTLIYHCRVYCFIVENIIILFTLNSEDIIDNETLVCRQNKVLEMLEKNYRVHCSLHNIVSVYSCCVLIIAKRFGLSLDFKLFIVCYAVV